MTGQLIEVPVSLLLSPALTPPAKLVWILCGEAGSPYRLSKMTGLARNTVLRALAELKQCAGPYEGPTVPVPHALLTDRRLGARTRLLYGSLLAMPGFSHSCGLFTYASLAEMTRFDPKTVRKAVAELVKAEWIRVEQSNRLEQVFFALTFPGLEQELTALAKAEWRLEKAEYYGEGLMREYLSLLIDSDQFEDDAAPGWLINPRTSEPLQLDRFYPPQVGFEFNGAQHYRRTERYSQEQSAAQRERDYFKLGICAARGVTLVVVHPEDLTIEGMRQKIGSRLPLRNLAGFGILRGYLEDESERYRRKVAHI